MRASILVPLGDPHRRLRHPVGWIFNQNGVANAILGRHVMGLGDLSARRPNHHRRRVEDGPYIGLLTWPGSRFIPDEVYEAAKIDGASAWKRFTSITLPLVSPRSWPWSSAPGRPARMFDLPYILIGPRKGSVETLSMLVGPGRDFQLATAAQQYLRLILFLYVFVFAVAFLKITNTDISGNDEAASAMSAAPVSAFFKRSRLLTFPDGY